MMARSAMTFAALTFVGVCFWLLVCHLSGVQEPWDADLYWTVAYPASALLAAVIGFRFDRRGWLAGAVLTLSQCPVMMVLSGTGSMAAFGFILTCALAVPVAIVSAASSGIGRRLRHPR